jgi:uncharacterized phage infection (PIP) family protein YhgE
MKKQDSGLSEQLDTLISRMQQIQKEIQATQQPASMHEIDELKQLGETYAEIVAKLGKAESQEDK